MAKGGKHTKGKSHQKAHLPEKICPVCQRPFTWRKKWERDWDSVIYCSKGCQKHKSQLKQMPLKDAIKVGFLKFIYIIFFMALVIGLGLIMFLQQDKATVQALYKQNACERCYHMTILKSKDKELVGQTIIPESDFINLENVIDKVIITKEPLCLSGKAYRYNWNILGIKPDGIRFEVLNILSKDKCSVL